LKVVGYELWHTRAIIWLCDRVQVIIHHIVPINNLQFFSQKCYWINHI
jgi:hypothetical protein